MHPEAVLLVDHGHPEAGEVHAFLDERMGPDRDVDGAVGDPSGNVTRDEPARR